MARSFKVRLVCPRNGNRADCPICGCPMPHQREEWAWSNARPLCEVHNIPLVIAQEGGRP